MPESDAFMRLFVINGLIIYLKIDVREVKVFLSALHIVVFLSGFEQEASETSLNIFLFLQLIYLKVTALLFPTSDFRHPVTTPALLYISQALTKVHTLLSVLLVCNHNHHHHHHHPLPFCLNPGSPCDLKHSE